VAYVLFPLLAWWALKVSSRAALASATAVLAVGVVLINLTTAASPNWSVEHHVMWIRISTDFTSGVLLWAWWRARDRGSARWDVIAVGSVLTTIVLSFFINPDAPVSFAFLPLVALFVLSCASATGPLARLLSSAPMQWGGKVSYSLFLGHFPVLLMLREFMPWEDAFDAPFPVRVGWLLMAALWIVGTGAVLYHFVEEPARRVILRHWARRQGLPTR
jgi:peptidoglycan/LPS O-acetylase OafA/YrhL